MDNIEKAELLIEKAQEMLKKCNRNSYQVDELDYSSWRIQCISFIKTCNLPSPSTINYSSEFESRVPSTNDYYSSKIDYFNGIRMGIGILKPLREDLETAMVIENRSDPIDIIGNLCERFHSRFAPIEVAA